VLSIALLVHIYILVMDYHGRLNWHFTSAGVAGVAAAGLLAALLASLAIHTYWYWTVSVGQLKAALVRAEAAPVPPVDPWRVPFLRRLLQERLQHHNNGSDKEEERVKSLINSLVKN
jgi:hypothetical protein